MKQSAKKVSDYDLGQYTDCHDWGVSWFASCLFEANFVVIPMNVRNHHLQTVYYPIHDLVILFSVL
jgi:hypothetical protein